MSPVISDPPPAPERDGSRERSARDRPELFGTLLASKPPHQRRLGPLAIAAILHIPLLAVLWITQGQRIISTLRVDPVTILLVDDNPPPIEHPARDREDREEEPPQQAQAEPPAAEQPESPGPERAPTGVPSNPTPGLPDPDRPIVPPAAEPTGTGGSGWPNSVFNRLSRPADPRVFGPPADAPAPTGPEAARARLATRIREINDSIAIEQEAQRRATDWTVTGEDGKRWGISPGKLHLGDITLPLPLNFSPPAGRRDEINQRVRDWAEIESQATRLDGKDSFGERVKEIRKRKERERADKKKVTASGG